MATAVARPSTDVARSRRALEGRRDRLTAGRAAFAALLLAAVPVPATAADTVRISGLSDLAFGSITNFATDSVLNESLCLAAKSPPGNNYRVTASGSGPGGAFALSSGSALLPFEVQWSATPGQTTGSQLLANQPLTGLNSSSSNAADDCSKGPATTASLIVILRTAALASATSGTYTGTLTLLVAPE
jgi:hypothetical protein